MNSFVKTSAILIVAATLISGCSQEKNPTPDQTVLQNPTRPVGNIGMDPNSIYGSGADSMGPGGTFEGDLGDDLELRDPSMGAFGDEDIINVVYFGYDEFGIRPSERIKLEEVADYLRNNPGTTLVAEGNTDWYGTTEYNLGLGDRRANAVKTYLVQLGISEDRVEILSLGELESDQDLPKDDPSVIDDRRVDLIIVGA